ncbi:MAG TPA: amino acid adenylation domain-containing protein [Kofleriaceae bacterium]|nr:amino acid adenylation domain-containing protein [Kofleriaceae bacterium]
MVARLNQEAARPFDLERGPLLRARLFTRGPDDRAIVLAVHHLVADLWSLTVLLQELGALLDARSRGQAPSLPPRGAAYTDHVREQERQLEGAEGERLWAYWRAQLQDAIPPLELPTDRPRPAVRRFGGGVVRRRLSAELWSRTRAFAARHNSTAFHVLLAAHGALLSRWSGQTDFAVGVPVADRARAGVARTVGYFVNPVPLRLRLDGGPTFAELLARTRETALEGLDHQALPFPLLVERLQPSSDRSRSPVFQSMFTFQQSHLAGLGALASVAVDEPGVSMRLGDLELRSIALDRRASPFDLSMSVAADDRGLALALEYSADLFDAPTIERFATCFENLLDAAIAGPSTPLEELDILPASERRDLLGWGNGPATGPSAPSDCVARFEAQASRTPDAVAITCEGRTTTYGALALRAADLASVLRTHGVGPDVRVGIHMRRSPEMVVSLLGVLTAGGAYVPLDPDDPADRRAMVLADASPRVVLTQPALAAALTARDGMTVLVVGSGEPSAADDLEEARGQGRRRPVDGDQLAYILYTSGSTGRPKGVMVSHRSLARYVDWAGRAYGAGPGGSAPVHSPLSFDLTVTSLLVPLTHGGAVTLISGDAATGALAGALRGRAALVKLTPAHLEMLAHQLEPTEPGERAHVFVVGGDALRTDVVRHWRERAPASRIINEYGPTETTVGCTIYEGPAVATASGTVPVGRPIAGARVHVLDRRCALQPVGVAGELFIGGDGLARGYVGRPDLTAERFVPDPSGEHPGARLYRSGDRARWRADGQLELLGRLDRQVKLRSHRIELGEIEAALTACSSVREAAVFLDRDGHEPRLVACIVWRPGQAADLTALRAALRAALPAHMVPGAFVALDALPLTPNGKLDRSALPRPGAAASGRPHVESRTSVETGLAEIFAQVLGVERPGAHDDFFALGGHSLLAIRVTAHLRDAFDVDVPVTAIFEAPTIAALAGRIEEARGRGRELPPLRPIARDGGPLRLSFAQERLWFLHQLEPDSPRYHVCAALRAVGPLDPSAFASAVGQVIDRHEILRTVFVDDEGRPAQLVRPFMAVPLAVLDLCGAPADARDATLADATREAAMRPFDLERGPLLRVLSIRIAEDEHVIVLVLHHIVFDGWSVDVLARELGALYAARLAGAPSPLPDLPVQYADYAAWQRAWLDGDRLAGQLAYWTGKLDGAPAALDLPTDRPRPARASGRGASLPIALAPAQVSALGACAARDGATLFMALCAAWAALLGRRAGQPEVVVGIPVASRRDAALEPLIGLFVNSLPLRVNLGGRPSFRALLARVRSTALEALAHQDLPFERIVEAVGPGRHPGRTPLFQTMLVVHTAPPTLALDRLSLAITEIPTHTAKLELTLTLTETAGGLAGALEYSTDLFDAASIAGLAADLERLLVAVVADPDAPVDSISLVGERERATAVTSPPQAEPDRRPPTAPRPPRDLERTLARIWCDVLGIDEVGRTEDFFDVGGHSLATTRVAARVARELGIKPPLAMFFEARTIAEQAARMAAELPATDRTPALRPIGRETPPPASSPQRRLWLLEQMEPGSTRHHIAGAARLRGQLSVDALERALQRIVERHEILRTTFLSVDGEPFQHVSPCATAVLERVDVSAVADPATRNAMALELAAEEARRPFDLAAGPLFRTRLVRVAELEHLLVVCFHHIVSDGWSRGVFLRDLGALYEAERDGAGALLPDLPVQYGDFAAWERDRLRRDAWADDLAHWKAKLATLPVLELPTDHARPRVATGRGGVVRFELPSGAEGDLRALCTATGATPFMVLVAAWGALLARHAGERRILIGTPVANRGRPELEELIGFFVNMLVLEVDLAGGPSFRQLVERVRGDALDAYAHQDLPFERLVEELNPPRDVGRAPIFQVMAVMNDAPAGRPRLADVSVEEVELDTVSSHCDLSLFLGQRDGAMAGAIQYSADLFDRETVERMADRFRALLAAATRRPDLTVDQLPMLSEAERRTIAVDWNDTSRSFDGPETLHALVRDQATRRPDATAVVFGDERMSFAELDRRASQLAHRLRSLGADVDRPVALILERSAELVVAILGVLKAGAAYVPIEPTLPAARIALVLDDVRPVAIVALQRLADRIPTAAIPAILIDADDLSAEPAHDPLVDVPPDASAYVIYTSGSTGRPKGVVVSHRAIRNRLLWMRDAFPLGESDVVLHKTPYGFDVSIWELFQPLLAGARLVVARPDGHRDAAYLIDEIVSRGVTVCHFVPSMLRLFLDEPGVERARCLSRVFTSGEALTPDLQDGLLDRVKCKVVNLYGPTEAAVEVSVWQCRYGSSTVPIGRPISNVRLHVVDAGGQLAPIGVPGELCIGGVALARGYLGQPALTAAAFVPDPFSPDAGARMYRTGDVARWRHDGAIEFLGRRDGQIKLRGQRVELGEIEAALLRVPDVKEAAVAVQDLGSDPRLVAYVVAQEGGRATAAEIRTRLRAALPATMVPAHLVFLAALPLTSSGKVDRKALPAPTLDREAASAPFAPPRDQTEGALAAIFSQVLAIERVGIEDDFFQLGGNSLLASRVIARIEGAFGRKLPLRDLFRAPTVAGLAAAISRDTPARRPSALVPMQARGDGHPIYFAPPISGSVAYYAKLARALGSEQPFIGLQARGLEGDGEPFSDIPSLAAWFADAIRQRQPRGPYRIGGWSLGGYTAWEIARILRASGEEVSSLILLSPPLPVEVPVRGGEVKDDAFFLGRLLSLERFPWNPGETLSAEERLRRVMDRARHYYTLEQTSRPWIAEFEGPGPRIPGGVDFDEAMRLVKVFKLSTWAQERYVPPPFDGEVDCSVCTAHAELGTPEQQVSSVRAFYGPRCAALRIDTIHARHTAMVTHDHHVAHLVGFMREALGRR